MVGAISTTRPWTQVEQRLGPAAESLEALLAEGQAGTFDLAFIGALHCAANGFVTPCVSFA